MVHEYRACDYSVARLSSNRFLLVFFSIGLATLLLLLLAMHAQAQPSGAAATCADGTSVPAAECQALVELYQQTGGDAWITRTNWLDFSQPGFPCNWSGVACNTGHVGELVLPGNQLSGTLPAALGSLTQVTRLRLENNALRGRIPSAFCDLVPTLGDASFAYNALFARSRSAERCANAVDSDWLATQTTKVTDLRPVEFYTDALRIAWTPISYTADGGYYEISIAVQRDGPYIVHGHTADKTASDYLIDGLTPAKSYFVEVRSVTPAHANQANTLVSNPALSAGATLASNGERVLVAAYFSADNDLASEINYVVQRFRFGTLLNPNVQVVLLVDGRQDGDTRVLEIAHGQVTTTDVVEQHWGHSELDTADPAVLTWFLQDARARYPSQREVAAIMGHGIAPIPEISWTSTGAAEAVRASAKIPPLPKEHEFTPSDITDSSSMSTVAVGKALLDATSQDANPFDIVFFDQCFQGSIDALYEVRKSATVFVASPNYAWLVAAYDKYILQFSPNSTPALLANDIVGAYQGSLDAHHPNAIFWVRSVDIDLIASAISDLGDALSRALQAGDAARIASAVQQSKYVDTTQCSRQNLQLGPPDEMIGMETFSQKLQENFGAGDSAGVYAAVDALHTAMSRVNKSSRAGNPYLAPDELWDYRDSLTLLAPLPRNSPAVVAWRASIYRSDAPFTARWTIDPSQVVTVTEGLAFANEGRWDDFLADWYASLTPTVGAWCNYSPPEQVILPDAATIALSAEISGADTIRLTWPPIDDADANELWLYTLTPNAIGWTVESTFPASETSTVLSGLAPGTYHFGLLARDETYVGIARSSDVTVTLSVEPGGLFLPLILR